MNELALGVLAQGGRVWVIDVGRSYEKLCGLLGGDFLTFDDENVWDANPLRYLTDESERVERVTAILEEFLGDGERDALLHQWLLLTLPILHREARAEGRTPTLPELIAAMRRVRKADDTPDQRFFDAAQKLAPYAEGGPLAKWTDGSGRPFDFSDEDVKIVVSAGKEFKERIMWEIATDWIDDICDSLYMLSVDDVAAICGDE